MSLLVFFFQAEDGIRDLVRSRGLGDVYKRQASEGEGRAGAPGRGAQGPVRGAGPHQRRGDRAVPVSYTHLDAADERSSVDLGGRRIIKKKKHQTHP